MRRLSDGRCRNGERQRRRRRCVTSFARNNNANDDRRELRSLGPGERVWGLIDSGVSQSWQQGSCAPPEAPGQPPYLPGEKRRRTGSAALHPSWPPHRGYGLNPIPAGRFRPGNPMWTVDICARGANPLMATIVHKPLELWICSSPSSVSAGYSDDVIHKPPRALGSPGPRPAAWCK
jgi:hypothetical protein